MKTPRNSSTHHTTSKRQVAPVRTSEQPGLPPKCPGVAGVVVRLLVRNIADGVILFTGRILFPDRPASTFSTPGFICKNSICRVEEVDESLIKIRSVMTEMLLKALPKDLAAEAITKRLEEPTKILLFVMIKYQPGSRKEKENLLAQIINPEVKWTNETALEGLRDWKRKIERAKELDLIIPDPSIMLSALGTITEKALKNDRRRTFRMES